MGYSRVESSEVTSAAHTNTDHAVITVSTSRTRTKPHYDYGIFPDTAFRHAITNHLVCDDLLLLVFKFNPHAQSPDPADVIIRRTARVPAPNPHYSSCPEQRPVVSSCMGSQMKVDSTSGRQTSIPKSGKTSIVAVVTDR